MDTSDEYSGPTADEAIARLIAGNERFLRGEARCAAPLRETLADLAKGQRPFATILGCSDSRVPPEWVFDAGLGEPVCRAWRNVFRRRLPGVLIRGSRTSRRRCSWCSATMGAGRWTQALATKYEAQHRSRIQPPGRCDPALVRRRRISSFRADAADPGRGEQRSLDGASGSSPHPKHAHGGGPNEDRRGGSMKSNPGVFGCFQ